MNGVKTKKLPASVRRWFATMGAEGGRIGGKIRAQRLTPERRLEIARKANKARWAKKNVSSSAKPATEAFRHSG